ncbi:MAG: DUF4132 domain-containing protein [Catenulispora sp.]|nr:DUF4132 domain-containing protein [Catenulispora sp.]
MPSADSTVTADLVANQASEDVCAIPAARQKQVIPRRRATGTTTEPRPANPRAAEELAAWLADQSTAVLAVLDEPASDADLVKDYRISNGDLTEATPRAAAVAAALAISPDTPSYASPADIVDAWIAMRGIAFAVEAAIDLFGIVVATSFDGQRTSKPQLHYRISDWPASYTIDRRYELATRLREHLATASETDYAQVAELLEAYRSSGPAPHDDATQQRMFTSFLMPERTDWVDADLAAFPADHRNMLAPWLAVCSISTREQTATLRTRNPGMLWVVREQRALWTAFDGVGADLLPVLITLLDEFSYPDSIEHLLSVLSCVASPEAFQHLVDNIIKKHYTAATLEAAKRFPRRALPLLSAAARRDNPAGVAAAAVLRMHVLANDDLIREELGSLEPAARAMVEELLAANVRVPDADPADLPGLFVDPPWLDGTSRPAKPVVIKGLEAPTETVMAWRDGEHEEWASRQVTDNPRWNNITLEAIAEKIAEEGTAYWYHDGYFAVNAPESLVRSVLPQWQPNSWQADAWVRRLVARFGAEALPPVLHLARRSPADFAHLLGPFAAPEAAVLAADWLSRLKSARPAARAWLDRHPATAARTLIPVALGKPGKARNAAELSLRMLAAGGHGDEIATAAAAYGETAATAVAAIAADDGTRVLPKVLPVIPDWAGPKLLPQIVLKDRETALPEAATAHLVMMLAISQPENPYPGVLLAREICDPASLARFAWALFETWRSVEFPAKEAWAFEALRWFGDDQTVRRLSPLIRLWPGENGHQRAVAGLDILAGIGGHMALMHLYGIAQNAKFKALKERATQRITDIAEDLGLTADQLGDRLVPDLGLDASGTLLLDYGPRHFNVGFDEQLKPYVADKSGKRIKSLPKPGAKDDPELAPAAYQRFSTLKKDARALASDQIARFELAMVAQRRWTREEFTEFFVAHPVLRHVARRLVWATYVDGRLHDTFRVAEDLSFADVAENEYRLAADAVIGIPHPLHFNELITTWSEVFADYEVVQPFDQLGRSVHAFTEQEAASATLTRFSGIDVPVGKVLGLERRGWRRGEPQDAGIQSWIYRRLPTGGSLAVTLDPGITVGYVTEFGATQRFEDVFICPFAEGGDYHSRQTYPALSTLDPVMATELLRDLTEATSG